MQHLQRTVFTTEGINMMPNNFFITNKDLLKKLLKSCGHMSLTISEII